MPDLEIKPSPEIPEDTQEQRELITKQQEMINKLLADRTRLTKIADVQHESWTDLSENLTQAINLINNGLNEVIRKSQEVYTQNP